MRKEIKDLYEIADSLINKNRVVVEKNLAVIKEYQDAFELILTQQESLFGVITIGENSKILVKIFSEPKCGFLTLNIRAYEERILVEEINYTFETEEYSTQNNLLENSESATQIVEIIRKVREFLVEQNSFLEIKLIDLINKEKRKEQTKIENSKPKHRSINKNTI